MISCPLHEISHAQMLRFLCIVTTLAFPSWVLPTGSTGQLQFHFARSHADGGPLNKKLVSAMRSWLKAYRKGKLSIGDDYLNIAGKSLAKKAGVITKGMFQRDNGVMKPGQFSYREEIAVMLEAAGKIDSQAIAELLLEYCAVGLDDATTYAPAMVPWYIRNLANQHLQVTPAASGEWLTSVAKGETRLKVSKPYQAALRAAALHALGRKGTADNLAVIRQGLADPGAAVRLIACELLGASGDQQNLEPLVGALATEDNLQVRQHLHLWIGRLISSCQHKVDEAQARKAADRLAEDLAVATPWHFQAQLVELMPVHGLPAYVPQLIEILGRFDTEAEQLRSGQLSGVLRQMTHQRLTSMTASYYAMDDVAGWRAFWDREKVGFALAAPSSEDPETARKNWLGQEKKRQAAGGLPDPTPDPKRTLTAGQPRSDFFGIPVRGSNVRFVVDVGYGMRLRLPITDSRFTDRWKASARRIDAMKIETARAVAGLGSDTTFNIIAFSDRSKTVFKKPTVARPKARASAKKFVDRLSPAKNYNLGAALTLALSAERLRFVHPASPVDEIFVVSNHMNQFGSIKAPDDVIGLVAETCRFSKVRIHTVYMGTVNDEDDKGELGVNTMKRIAELTGGQFIRL